MLGLIIKWPVLLVGFCMAFDRGTIWKKKKGHLQLEQYIYIVDGIQDKSIVNLRLGFKQLKLVAELKTVDV